MGSPPATRVLIAEDDAAVRSLLHLTLLGLGYDVIEAADGREALHAMEGWEPDLLILDEMMPRLSGTQFLKELSRLNLKKKPRIMMLTAKRAEADFLTAYRLGAHLYLTKPFDPEEVVDTVGQLLNMSVEQLESRRQEEIRKAGVLEKVERVFPPEPG